MKDLEKVVQLAQQRYQDPYFDMYIHEIRKIRNDLQLTKDAEDLARIIAERLPDVADVQVTIKEVVDLFLESILESDMQGICLLPTDIEALLDSLVYLLWCKT